MNALALRLFAASILILVCCLTVLPQTPKPAGKPDFSGSWLLDQKKSNDSGLTTRPDLPIKISHQDPQFTITRSSELKGQIVEHDFVYFTDGRGEENPATSFLTTNPSGGKRNDLKNKITKSKTKWSGNKIVTRTAMQLQVAGHFVEFEQIDEWKVSSDGKLLTQTTRLNFVNSDTAFVPTMAQDKKRVYNRV